MLLVYLPSLYCLFLMLLFMPILLLKRQPVPAIRSKNVAVLIPTYNDSETILKVLESIKNQSDGNILTTFIIDDGSTDNTLSKVLSWCDKYESYFSISIPNNSGRKGAAIEYARDYISNDFDVVVCIDADTVLHSDAINNSIAKLYSKSNIAAVTGCVIPLESARKTCVYFAQKFELEGAFHAFKLIQSDLGCINTLAGALSVYKREALEEIGWFSDWLVEDICWTWKACALGMDVKYAENAIGWTACPSSYTQYFKQRRRWARGRIEAIKSVNNMRGIWSIIPWFIFSFMQFLLFPSLLYLAFISPISLVVILGMLSFCHFIYAWHTYFILDKLVSNISSPIVSGLATSFIIEILMFVPNLLGMLDEIFNKDKKWLTR
ncbi:glycosyltransferase family 2 protein [Raoultella sp. RIT712]|uniref:glycosyltransferase n=1 Tax=unclassified Raoultella TaxID=2627600 RepID=UPI0012ADAD4B|nr:glycosyltransferase family 2 protein [Raoultella sp. RIT712]MRT47645.1 glycosyltransferase [Raoultella sp. RIT712]